jgi:hypothetical protein
MMVITGVADVVVVDVETTTGTAMVAIIVMVVAEVAGIVVVEKVSTLELLYPSPNTTISGEKSRTICRFE